MTRSLSLPRLAAPLLALLLPAVALAESSATTRVQITSDPAGAAVYVDGAIGRAGDTPVTLALTQGEHRIRLVLEGYATEERTITVTRSRQTLSFRLISMARVEVSAATDSAQGATVSVDGVEIGPIPLTHNLDPGRHEIRVEREGYRPFSRWLEVSPGQSYALGVSLTPDAATAPPSGPGPSPTPTPAPSGGGGSLRVLSRPAGAAITVDGEDAGAAPVTIEDLLPGSHIVEASLAGHDRASQRVSIEAGRRETILLELSRSASVGALRVTSEVEGATVLLDGTELGAAPVTREGIEAGAHRVVVRAADHEDWEQQVQIAAGETIEVHATPRRVARNGLLSVDADAPGAEVLIDDVVVGNAPLTSYEIPAGRHDLEVRAAGFEPFRREITIEAGEALRIAAPLVSASATTPHDEEAGEGAGPVEGDGQDEVEGPVEGAGEGEGEGEAAGEEPRDDEDLPRFVYSGAALRPWKLALDLSWGWPWFVGHYRFSMGVYDNIDVALEVRSFYRWTEIDGRVRYGARLVRILTLGAQLEIGGGFGSGDAGDGRNSFVFGITAFQGLAIRRVAVTLRERLRLFSDRYHSNPSVSRRGGAIFYVGAALEVQITRAIHVFLVVDYAPAQSKSAPRRVYCWDEWDYLGSNSCPSGFPGSIDIEARAGVGFRFR